jgi:hypothetical protein
VLTSPAWFCDDIRDLDNKDELAKLPSNWILELAEVDYLMGRKEVESFKRFLSTRSDTYRPPYGRANITIPRSCSFFATTNKTEFLADPTGDRRYWVVEVMQKIDCEVVATYRDMIWASALAAYERGDDWWLSDEEDISRCDSHSKYRESDPWVDVILGRGAKIPTTPHGTGEYTIVDRIFSLLDLTTIQCDRKARNRVVKVLLELGFEDKVFKLDGKNKKVWYRELPLPSLKPLPILKKIGSGQDPVGEPALLTLPTLPSFNNDKKDIDKKEEMHTCMYVNEEKEIDRSPISEKIGSTDNIGSNGSVEDFQPLPMSKKIGSRGEIGSGTGFKVGDRVQYVGSNANLKTQYAGELVVHEISPSGITCKLPNGNLGSWIDPEDLQFLNK